MPPEFAEQLRAAAEAGAAAGERRPVTILFADLSGFTALSETVDPEDLAVLVDRCLGAMADAIYRYQGTVDKYIGDCVMALFGAPVAHEDDPERAIRAALEMRDQIAAIATQDSSPLSLHVGINTGVVVAGAVGSDRRREYTVLGDAVNVAARLEGVATDGEIIVGEPSYRLARHVVAFEPLGALSLKGRAESLQAYRVLGLLPEPASARGLESHALSAPLIGREQELEQVFAAFERTLVGRTQVVSLIGEAGAGKTRLQREFFRRLQSERPDDAARLTVRRAFCSALGEEAYGVLRAIFHDALGMAPDEPPEMVKERIVGLLATLGQDAATIRHAAPLVGHLLGVERDDPLLRQVEPEQLKRQLFLVVRDLIDRRLQQGPYILVVEDLHWADVASIELLRFIVDRLGDRQLMLLVTHRPTFEAGSLASSRATYSAVRLAPLSSDQSAALLEAFFGDSVACLPSRLRELIIGRAGGNPFYLEEVVRGLIEAGVLVREAVGWRCAEDVAVVEVPPTVQGVLLARLDRLSPGERRLVQEASVLGLEFGEGLLRAVSSEPETMEVHLDLLQDAELLQETARPAGALTTAERRYRFSHALVQEVAYGSLLVRRRTELHGRIGQTLEHVHGERPERLEDLEALGHHFSLSADKLRGVRYMTAAGDSARALYANEDAARCYERALDTLAMHDTVARAQQVQLWERLGDALGAVGRRADALRNFTAALEAAQQAENRPVQARLHRKIGRLRWEAGEREPALDELRAGLAVLEGQAEHIELAHLYQEMGRLAFRNGAGEQAIAWARRAVDLAERIADTADSPDARREAAAAIAHAYNTIGIAMARAGGSEAAVEQLERSLAVAYEHELLQAACRAHTNLGVLYSTLDPGRAIETCLDGLDLARKIGDLGLQPWLYANLAGAYCTFTGQCEEQGIAAAHQAIELDRQLGQLDHLAVPLIVLGQIYQCHGEPARALQYYQEALSLAEQMGEPQLLFPCYDGLATLSLEEGDEAEAERYMLKAQEVCERAGLDPESLVVLPFLG